MQQWIFWAFLLSLLPSVLIAQDFSSMMPMDPMAIQHQKLSRKEKKDILVTFEAQIIKEMFLKQCMIQNISFLDEEEKAEDAALLQQFDMQNDYFTDAMALKLAKQDIFKLKAYFKRRGINPEQAQKQSTARN
ncbi:MAG: hypothetical protein AB7F28_01605 [Candidatus Margulisiibacteriota bacterium]